MRGGLHHRGRGERCKSGAPAAASLPAIGPRGQRLRQAVCPAAVPRHLRRRSSSRLEGENDDPCGPAERSGEGRRARARTNRPTRSSGGAGRCAAGERARRSARRRARFARTEFDRATRSRRQPGSAFKPFVHAAALERDFTPVTLLDQPENAGQGVGDWRPRNANYSSDEPMPLREAFIESNNRAAVGVQQAIGRVRFSIWEQLGLDELPGRRLPGLGTGAVSPLQLTAAYAVFPNGGYAVRPHGPRPSRTRMASKCGSMTTRPSA